MLNLPNPFAETGAASSILALKEDLGADFVGTGSQLNLTPFQRQMFEAEKARQAEAQEEKMSQARGGSSRRQNSMNSQSPPASSGKSRSETVRYINEGDDNDEETLSVIK